jgi:hypothetical protein
MARPSPQASVVAGQRTSVGRTRALPETRAAMPSTVPSRSIAGSSSPDAVIITESSAITRRATLGSSTSARAGARTLHPSFARHPTCARATVRSRTRNAPKRSDGSRPVSAVVNALRPSARVKRPVSCSSARPLVNGIVSRRPSCRSAWVIAVPLTRKRPRADVSVTGAREAGAELQSRSTVAVAESSVTIGAHGAGSPKSSTARSYCTVAPTRASVTLRTRTAAVSLPMRASAAPAGAVAPSNGPLRAVVPVAGMSIPPTRITPANCRLPSGARRSRRMRASPATGRSTVASSSPPITRGLAPVRAITRSRAIAVISRGAPAPMVRRSGTGPLTTNRSTSPPITRTPRSDAISAMPTTTSTAPSDAAAAGSRNTKRWIRLRPPFTPYGFPSASYAVTCQA